MAIPVKLEVFEGPLDLLLHLIDVNKIDIYDIPIVEITEQYLEYIRQMEQEDMNVTSEFLLMAATLLDIKSKMLLPKPETGEDGEEIDPRDELVQKLLDYKMYKYMSQELRLKEEEAGFTFYREKNIPKEVQAYMPPVNYEELIGDATLSELNNIFQQILRRAEDRRDPIRSTFGDIEREEIDMDEKKLYVHAYILEHKRIHFQSLLEKQNSKSEIIVTFIIVLELIKSGDALVEQDKTFGEIYVIAADPERKGTDEHNRQE
ncbi:MAG: segregation/condensation protein A [Lachnospiraceae bacterium]|nr:segregation/condensation protein A [Lachnospiraceae bacterium]